MSHGRRAAGLVLVTALAASLTACGGSDEPSTTGPTSSSTSAAPSPSESASSSPSATSTTPALSRFEDDPAVQGLRAWAAAIGEDINNGDLSFARTTPLTVPANRKNLKVYAGNDIAAKLQYPGPLPFTPVRLRTAGKTTTVVACSWDKGWGVDPTTNKPKDKRSISGGDFVMTQTANGWKLKDLTANDIDCSGVNVKGIPS